MPSFISAILTAMIGGLAAANPFTLTAYLPGHAINGQIVNAAAESLFLGLPGPSSFCPVPTVPTNQCPAGTKTLFVGALSMWVEVPGGEMGYVSPDGEIKYTGPHSASMPPGSFVGGFTAKKISVYSDGPQETLMSWKAPGKKHGRFDYGDTVSIKLNGATVVGGIYACPHVPSFVNATYQIYAKTATFDQKDCVKLKGLLQHEEPTNDFGAWEYT